jgi:hypothetical protein
MMKNILCVLKKKDIVILDDDSDILNQLFNTFNEVGLNVKTILNYNELKNIDLDFLILHNEFSELTMYNSIRDDVNIYMLSDYDMEFGLNLDNLTVLDIDTLSYIDLIKDMYNICQV